MKIHMTYKIIAISTVLILCGTNVISIPIKQIVPQYEEQSNTLVNSQILFAPMDSTITYLIDNTGTINHTWPSDYFPGEAVRWLGDGTILRSIKVGFSGSGGSGGGVQKILWDGTITWEFRYNTDGYLSHHDLLPLPNGNVLLIAWETKTRTEAINAGRNPDIIFEDTFMPDHIIEVEPTGPTSGNIVWEWHVWDHLIQDYDSLKANYGVVADHPELIDVNYGLIDPFLTDWLHTDSIDYNEKFDQILISVHNFNEIWVIDHSTTTAEAAGHTGGNSGKGGDLLYRWGNPEAYRAGTSDDQKYFGQHDATWIKTGCPGEGNILVFNNGFQRPAGMYSSVDEIVPPVNDNGEYYLESGSSYGPENFIWSYLANPPSSFYSGLFSGAQRLTDGNTLICNGEAGRFFEVTPTGTTVWEYTNTYPIPSLNNVFKIVCIPPNEPSKGPDLDCIGSLSWNRVKPGQIVNGSFQVQNIGISGSLLNWTINISYLNWGTWSFNQESGEDLTPEDGPLTIQVSVVAPNKKRSEFQGYIRVENKNNSNDFDVIPVTLKTPANSSPIQIMSYFFLYNFKQFFFLFEKIFNIFEFFF